MSDENNAVNGAKQSELHNAVQEKIANSTAAYLKHYDNEINDYVSALYDVDTSLDPSSITWPTLPLTFESNTEEA